MVATEELWILVRLQNHQFGHKLAKTLTFIQNNRKCHNFIWQECILVVLAVVWLHHWQKSCGSWHLGWAHWTDSSKNWESCLLNDARPLPALLVTSPLELTLVIDMPGYAVFSLPWDWLICWDWSASMISILLQNAAQDELELRVVSQREIYYTYCFAKNSFRRESLSKGGPLHLVGYQ